MSTTIKYLLIFVPLCGAAMAAERNESHTLTISAKAHISGLRAARILASMSPVLNQDQKARGRRKHKAPGKMRRRQRNSRSTRKTTGNPFFPRERKVCKNARIDERPAPERCDLCNKEIQPRTRKDSGQANLTDYNDHFVRYHTTPYDQEKGEILCLICGLIIRHKTITGRHMRTHSGERPYECPTCDKRFNQDKTWNQHKKRCRRDTTPSPVLPTFVNTFAE